MPDNKLVLHPVNPWAILQDPGRLLEALRGAGLVGASFNHLGEPHYKTGPRFRELVVLKAVERPAAGPEPPYHVSLLETTADAAFLGAANTQAPLCPACGHRFSAWRDEIIAWQRDTHGHRWPCPGCGAKLQAHQLDWARTGGVARYSLDLWGIREGEAEPSEELLGILERETEESWTYFYYRL